MKKLAIAVILLLIALLAWDLFSASADLAFNIDGEQVDGPLGALLGVLFAGGGLIIAGVVMLFVGLVLAVVFAGVGMLVVAALGLAAVIVATVLSPLLLLPLLPLVIVWLVVQRVRRNRLKAQQV
jgi:hypothetical protein